MVFNLRVLAEKQVERFLNWYIFWLIVLIFDRLFHLLSSTHEFYTFRGFILFIISPPNVPLFRFRVLNILYKTLDEEPE